METKDCLILDVRISSLEVDLRVPGNRDEFPFSLPSGPSIELFPPVVIVPSAKIQFPSLGAKTYRHNG